MRGGIFLFSVCLTLVLLLCVWLRVLGVGGLPAGQFTEHDAYLYQHQAEIVSQTGGLPGRDMRRWLPAGRDTTQSLNVYPLVLGWTHRFLRFFFPGVSVYLLVFYAPVVCFSLALLCICLFFARTEGLGVSLMVGLLLATLPGTIERSSAGFGDRDAWCFLIGVSAVVTYLWSLSVEVYRQRLLWTLLSGVLVFIGGLSWEGFGVFVSLVLCVEVSRFLRTDREEGLFFYGLWVLCFVPMLYLFSPAYRSGVGWSTHVFSLMLVPPVAIFAVRVLRYWLLEVSPVRAPLLARCRQVSLALVLFSVVCGLVYVVSLESSFAATTVAFGESALLRSIGELVAPETPYWVHRYGSVFLTGSLGVSLLPLFRWGRCGFRLSVSLFCFCVLVFFRSPLASVWDSAMGDALFSLSVVGVCVAFGIVSWRAPPAPGVCATEVALVFWCLIWFSLARSAKRYDFFMGLGLAYFTVVLLREVATGVVEALRNPKWTTAVVHDLLKRYRLTPASVSVLLLCGVCLWGPMDGGHIFRAQGASTRMRRAVPGEGALMDAYTWMKTNLPAASVVAAEWSYGTQLNVLGGVGTIMDPDHYLPDRIALYHREVIYAPDEAAVLRFLFRYDVTHLLVTAVKHPEGTLLRGGSLSGVFQRLYPKDNFDTSRVKLYELRYPAGLEKRPEYLLRSASAGEGK